VTGRAAARTTPRHTLAYDELAAGYDAWKWQGFWRRNEAPVVADLLSHEPVARRALDIGAGTGALSVLLAERAESVLAVDASQGMLQRLRATRPGALAVQGEAEALPFAAGSFDRAGAARLLSHLDDPLAALRECARVTAPGAAVVVTDLHPEFDYEQSTLGFAACSSPFSPIRHPLPAVADAATAAGFSVELLRVYRQEDLLWRPPPGTFLTLDANHGAVFYVALLRRR
jgi:ubiquinone/menaquinone biosynthesis C-methylase UbiE